MDTKTSFTQAHLENRLWANELEFYREEMNIFQAHMKDLTSRSTSLQESDRANHFENQFSRFRELINQLEHDLFHAEKQMALYAKSNQSKDLDEVNIGDHQQFKNKVEDFKEQYLRFRQQFKDFEASL